jgi:uncharacterized protein (DUF2384 family)
MSHAALQYLENLEKDGGLKSTDIANIVDVSKPTISRWKARRYQPQPGHELILSDLNYLVLRLSEYYSPDEIRSWLYARHPQLDGRRAIDLVHDRRTEAVLRVLERLDNDVYL